MIRAILLSLIFFFGAAEAQAKDLLVFAAASLQTALDEACRQWQGQTGQKISVSYAASGPLAKQIEAGAPADLFIAADLAWMDFLAARMAIHPESRVNLLRNDLVLVAPKSYPGTVVLSRDLDLLALLKDGRLAMGDPDSVPAGTYGRAALTSLGLYAKIEGRLARAESVRAALALVSRGEAPFGIVYASDAVADTGVRVVAMFAEASHPPIVYPAALTRTGDPEAGAFLRWLATPAAQAIFVRFGFKSAF